MGSARRAWVRMALRATMVEVQEVQQLAGWAHQEEHGWQDGCAARRRVTWSRQGDR